MARYELSSDGDYYISPGSGPTEVTRSAVSTVMVVDNVDGATLTYGLEGDSSNFVEYPNGTIAVGDIIAHGMGVKLMVQVSGITSNPVILRVNQHES